MDDLMQELNHNSTGNSETVSSYLNGRYTPTRVRGR